MCLYSATFEPSPAFGAANTFKGLRTARQADLNRIKEFEADGWEPATIGSCQTLVDTHRPDETLRPGPTQTAHSE